MYKQLKKDSLPLLNEEPLDLNMKFPSTRMLWETPFNIKRVAGFILIIAAKFPFTCTWILSEQSLPILINSQSNGALIITSLVKY